MFGEDLNESENERRRKKIEERQVKYLKSGAPMGIRTPVTGVKGQRPRPLDDGDTTLSSISKTRTHDK
jgi:hypothetical protein